MPSVKDATMPVADTMEAGVVINGTHSVAFEVDTAACQNIMSSDIFDNIVSKSVVNQPTLSKGNIVMRLADGTPSPHLRGCTYMTIARADIPDIVHTVPFFIIKGPHCLLGRPTLKKLWPDQYSKLYEVARRSMEAISGSAVVSDEHASVPLMYDASQLVKTYTYEDLNLDIYKMNQLPDPNATAVPVCKVVGSTPRPYRSSTQKSTDLAPLKLIKKVPD